MRPTEFSSSPTIADVARVAAVSTATVSRFLSNPSRVAPARRTAIAMAVETLGYVPDAIAQALASRRSRMVGAVFPRLSSILFGSFFDTLQRRLGQVGYLLAVTSSEYDAASEEQQVRALVARGVDAMILVGHSHRAEAIALLDRAGIPRVHCWTYRNGVEDVQIGFSNEEAMARVVDHVVGLGHRRIALLSGQTQDNDRAAGRLAGARARLAERGLGLPADLVEEVPFDIDEGAAAFGRLMERAAPPTAVLCGSDLLAFGALREARRRKISVPRDVSVTGFDDTEFAACIEPALTSLRTPRETMAARVAEAIIERLDRDRPLRSLRLETSLVVRDSSGQAPAVSDSGG